MYVLLADEATDVSHNKQLSICLRLVDDQYVIREFFMGFVRLFQFDAVSLAKEISDFLITHNISFAECIVQCFDGYIEDNLNIQSLSSFLYFLSASVMAGQCNGVHVILRQNFMPRAMYIHCMVHRVNLVVCDVCSLVPYIDEFFSIVSKIHGYFTKSGITNRYFCDAQKSLELSKKNKNRHIFHVIFPIFFNKLPPQH